MILLDNLNAINIDIIETRVKLANGANRQFLTVLLFEILMKNYLKGIENNNKYSQRLLHYIFEFKLVFKLINY